ncbi:MAG: hypothetical protein JWQ27_2908 [Ferruginibacter sp.]|nr:hypothetical protein [Ferruginibacter sp.]
MKHILILAFSLLFLASCNSRSGSGTIITENRTTENFTGISVSNSITVELRTGAAFQVRVEADDNLMKYVATDVEDGQLRIRLKDRMNVRNANIHVFITAPEISKIVASSAADVKAIGVLRAAASISLDVSSAAKIEANVDAPKVSLEASSAGNIDVSGKTQSMSAESSSGSDINAYDLLCETARASASSGASIKLHASVALDANSSSGASIHHHGGAKVQQTASSGGSVTNDE